MFEWSKSRVCPTQVSNALEEALGRAAAAGGKLTLRSKRAAPGVTALPHALFEGEYRRGVSQVC